MGDAAVDVGTVQKGWRTRHTGMVVASALVLCVALPSMLAMEGTRVHANGTGLSSKSIEVSGAKSTAAAAAHTRLAAKVTPFLPPPPSPPPIPSHMNLFEEVSSFSSLLSTFSAPSHAPHFLEHPRKTRSHTPPGIERTHSGAAAPPLTALPRLASRPPLQPPPPTVRRQQQHPSPQPLLLPPSSPPRRHLQRMPLRRFRRSRLLPPPWQRSRRPLLSLPPRYPQSTHSNPKPQSPSL